MAGGASVGSTVDRYGSAMTWQETATAVGTIGATMAAIGLGATAEIRNARDRRFRHATDEQRQAARVSAWLVRRTANDGATSVRPSTVVVLQNASDEPVWDVQFSVRHGDHSGAIHDLHVLAPGTVESPLDGNLDPACPVRVSFRDNAGREWIRDEDGRITRWGAV